MEWRFCACLSIFLIATSLFAAPANDDYENRTVLSGTSVTFNGTLVGATLQQGELLPDYAATNQYSFVWAAAPTSVWWTWTAPQSGYVTVRFLDYTDSRVREGFIAVWRNVDWPNRTGTNVGGTLCHLTGQRYVTFFATAGVAYDLQLQGGAYGSFTLQLTDTAAPIITSQPASQKITAGESTFLGVSTAGLGPFTYQWRFNGTNLAQESGAILLLDNFQTNMAGTYSVIVSNTATAVQSAPAIITLSAGDTRPILTLGNVVPNPAPYSAPALTFTLSGEPGRSYQLQSSTDMISWNNSDGFNPPGFWIGPGYYGCAAIIPPGTRVLSLGTPAAQFFRVVRYMPHPNPIARACINHLKAIRFAKEIWESQKNSFTAWGGLPGDWPASADLIPLFRAPPACPYDDQSNMDVSYDITSISSYPECKFNPFQHILQEAP